MKLKPPTFLILFLFFITGPSFAHAQENVWDVMRHQFALNHEIRQPEVQNQLRWLLAHPNYLSKLAQSEPYIYHILTEVKKRGLPGEIALIPMIESSYNPFAYSGVGAAGLWQLMPGTGTDLGLKQDWWADNRRSIPASTDAALNYFIHLNQSFNGDWILAIAAYDAGEGNLSRIIKNNTHYGQKINFWSLPVPDETKAYIPRLLALAEIIQNPQRYQAKLPDIPHAPYFEEVNIGSQIDLNHAARLAGISYHELIQLNPSYNRWTTAPYYPYKLLIPRDKVKAFNHNLANLPETKRVSWTRYQVIAGDNLNLIAEKYHTTVKLIKELNQLKSNTVKEGQFVLIPNSKNTPYNLQNSFVKTQEKTPHFVAASQYKILHIVQKNDSYASVQNKYHVSIDDIRAWNQLKPNTSLTEGQQLIIWKRGSTANFYIVQKGDSLNEISMKHSTKISTLIQLNPELKQNVLHPGQRIRLI